MAYLNLDSEVGHSVLTSAIGARLSQKNAIIKVFSRYSLSEILSSTNVGIYIEMVEVLEYWRLVN